MFRHFVITAVCSTSEISVCRHGTFDYLHTRRIKVHEKHTCLNTHNMQRPHDPLPIYNLTYHRSRCRRHYKRRPVIAMRVSTHIHTSTRAPPPPAARGKSAQAPWLTSSTTPNPGKIWIGPKYPNPGNENAYKISSTDGNTANEGLQPKATVEVVAIMLVLVESAAT